MGEPVRILDLARAMIELSGLDPDRDIEVEVVGRARRREAARGAVQQLRARARDDRREDPAGRTRAARRGEQSSRCSRRSACSCSRATRQASRRRSPSCRRCTSRPARRRSATTAFGRSPRAARRPARCACAPRTLSGFMTRRRSRSRSRAKSRRSARSLRSLRCLESPSSRCWSSRRRVSCGACASGRAALPSARPKRASGSAPKRPRA